MNHCVSKWTTTCALAGIMALAGGERAQAQEVSLRGVVVDTAGSPIANADVGVAALHRLTRTDDSGRFVLAEIQAGPVQLSVRRLSYEPRKINMVASVAGEPLRVVLKTNVALLEGVTVTAGEMRRREQIEDFYRRMTRGIGTYVTREDIDGRVSGTPSDMLRSVPGIRFVKVSSGRGIRFPNTSLSRRDCAPMIWIDGQKAPGLEIDDVTLTDIEGIEIYNGPSTTPFQFSQGAASHTCGTIVIWSRPPTRRTQR
ncbi:MAG TPA: TonB-dependent receptor [Gemmatimonadaceae bacterium]|nr:TonB-dependent receptor [Gemmatimonadaceae bacterium]